MTLGIYVVASSHTQSRAHTQLQTDTRARVCRAVHRAEMRLLRGAVVLVFLLSLTIILPANAAPKKGPRSNAVRVACPVRVYVSVCLCVCVSVCL